MVLGLFGKSKKKKAPSGPPQDVAWVKSAKNRYFKFLNLEPDEMGLENISAVYVLWHQGVRPQWVYVGWADNLEHAFVNLQRDDEILDYDRHGGLYVTWSMIKPEFQPGVVELCRQHGIVTIADEIQAGTGRTGRFLASEHFGIEPDIVVLAKALAGGYPLSAVVGRSEIMDAPGPSAIGGTYVGNPVACAAANAVLDVIEEEGLLERAEHVGKTIRSRWEEIARDVPEVGEVRGLGAMIGVELVSDRETKEPAADYLARFMAETERRGVVTVGCGIYHNVLRHLVPLVITDDQLAEAMDVLAESAVAVRG